MSAPDSNGTQAFVLNGLHIMLAALLLFLSFLVHGRIPGFSADASAALGFLFVLYLGLPAILAGVGTLLWSILAKGHRLPQLALSLVAATILMAVNAWTGFFASVLYLAFGIWTFVQRIRARRLGATS